MTLTSFNEIFDECTKLKSFVLIGNIFSCDDSLIITESDGNLEQLLLYLKPAIPKRLDERTLHSLSCTETCYSVFRIH